MQLMPGAVLAFTNSKPRLSALSLIHAAPGLRLASSPGCHNPIVTLRYVPSFLCRADSHCALVHPYTFITHAPFPVPLEASCTHSVYHHHHQSLIFHETPSLASFHANHSLLHTASSSRACLEFKAIRAVSRVIRDPIVDCPPCSTHRTSLKAAGEPTFLFCPSFYVGIPS